MFINQYGYCLAHMHSIDTQGITYKYLQLTEEQMDAKILTISRMIGYDHLQLYKHGTYLAWIEIKRHPQIIGYPPIIKLAQRSQQFQAIRNITLREVFEKCS